MTRSRLAFGASFVIGAAACGGGVSVAPEPSGDDAGPEDAYATPLDARARDADPDAAPYAAYDAELALDADTLACPYPVSAGDGGFPRCPDATYTSSPSGGACDPSRIWLGHVRGNSCSGPPLGTYCDYLEIVVADRDAPRLSSGWSCQKGAQPSTMRCQWPLSDAGGGGMIDAPALDAACAATELGGACTYVVTCIVLD